jgi:hypothetical protein
LALFVLTAGGLVGGAKAPRRYEADELIRHFSSNAVHLSVVPAKAGIQKSCIYWVPAFAGTTNLRVIALTELNYRFSRAFFRPVDRGKEKIARSIDRFNKRRTFGIRLQLAAQAGDADVDAAVGGREITRAH